MLISADALNRSVPRCILLGKLSTAEVLRLRATSALSRNQSVRRSAQDDDSVGSLTKNILNKLALMVLRPGLCQPSRGTEVASRVLTQTLQLRSNPPAELRLWIGELPVPHEQCG